jgi:hypothetical protein
MPRYIGAPSVNQGIDWVEIASQKATGVSSISFIAESNGVIFDSTFNEYKFEYSSIHPATDAKDFTFQGTIDGGSNFNVAIQSGTWATSHDEAGSATSFAYDGDGDQALGTAYQQISDEVGNGADESVSGELILYVPHSTTYVKHIIANSICYRSDNYVVNYTTSGYFNDADDEIIGVDFKFASGNIDEGIITMYGLSMP